MIIKTAIPSQPARWAVIGGGMMGLTLAHRLARAGKDVTLIEAADQLGGLASCWKLGDVTWDRYYHVILLTDTYLRSLLKEIDLDDKLRWTETKTGFFTEGELYSMSNTLEFLNFPPLKLLEKLRLGWTIFYASKIRNWKRLERIGVTQWLRRWSGNGTFEKIWEPLLNAKLGESYEKTAASFIWASINRMYKARRSGLKKEMFGYVDGGYRTIIARLAERLEADAVEIKTGFPIRQINKGTDGTFTVESSDGQRDTFDRVIITTPSSVASRICPLLSQDEQSRLQKIDYLGIICASMLIKKPISPYYVTNITDRWVPMTAVIEMSNIVDSAELGNRSLVYLPKYIPSNHPMFERSDEDIQSEFIAALEQMYPTFTGHDVEAFRISRAKCYGHSDASILRIAPADEDFR